MDSAAFSRGPLLDGCVTASSAQTRTSDTVTPDSVIAEISSE